MSKKILIVEDEMIVQMHLEQIVSGLGHDVSGTAASTHEAIESAEQDAPELVLMDIRLADGGDGVETARVLRERFGCAVIFVTAYADAATVERTTAVVPAGYIVKPFTGAAVRAAITTALTGHDHMRQTRERDRAEMPTASALPRPHGGRRPFGVDTRLVVYSHDTFGLGHLRRCLNLIRALAERNPGLSTLLVTGSPVVHRYPMPPGTDYLKLPAVRKVAPGAYEARSLSMSGEGIHAMRSNLLMNTIRDYHPDVLLVDHSPTGMNGEMLQSLEWLRAQGSCTSILGLRDIIDEPARVQAQWQDKGIFDVLRNLYDHIAVYGSRDVYDTVGEYGFPADIAAKAHFVNYVSRKDEPESEETARQDDNVPMVAVTIGGGDGGAETVVGPFLDMLAQYRSEIGFRAEMLVGPLVTADLEQRYRDQAASLPVDLKSFVPVPAQLYRRADLVVATAGYNTTTELLGYAKRALLIPRVLHRKEQITRARRLEELGLVSCLHPEDVTPERLLREIQRALGDPVQPLTEGRARGAVPLDGAERFADFCASLHVGVTTGVAL